MQTAKYFHFRAKYGNIAVQRLPRQAKTHRAFDGRKSSGPAASADGRGASVCRRCRIFRAAGGAFSFRPPFIVDKRGGICYNDKAVGACPLSATIRRPHGADDAQKRDRTIGRSKKTKQHRGVAQFGSALGSGPRGRGFKSRHLDHKQGFAAWQCPACFARPVIPSRRGSSYL